MSRPRCKLCYTLLVKREHPTELAASLGTWFDHPAETYALGHTHAALVPKVLCSCSTGRDGSVTRLLCPIHAEVDPCEVFARVTGKRRRGTIRRGTCTNCGWKDPDWHPTSTWTRVPRGERYPLTVGKAYDLGTDPTDGTWAVICEQHFTVVGVDTRAEALTVRSFDFCQDCRDEREEVTAN